MPSSPLFSIVIPTYNRAHLIAKTLNSVLAQHFTDFEILVVDDGSKDNTAEVVRGFSDSRVTYYKKENDERGAARNYGTARAHGSYITFFDSDDLMYPNHLRVASNLVASIGNPEWFHLAYDYQLEDGSVINQINDFDEHIQQTIYFNNRLSCNGVFLRRDIALQFPFEEDRVLASSEDWELWIRLLSHFKLHYSNEITSSVVNHDQRSLFTIPAEKVIARDLLLIEKLRADAVVMKQYGQSFKRFIADRYTFFMLCLAEQKQRLGVWQWGMRAFQSYPLILGSKRFLASIKNSILP
ncbi:MAG: glycosyltransferase family 2 protein [Cyclobacteriaceae bacterium]|nr:glycosyltransferase family 2 protein [Cyclobacteriaceae bacterium]